METTSFEASQEDISPDYSFKEKVKSYPLIKKFFIILILPLIPIYSVSKYFEVKNVRQGKKSRFKRYFLIMVLLYTLTIYPLAFSILWIQLQIFLFPISFIVAWYYHYYGRKEKIEIIQPLEGDDFNFQVIKFRKFSITFLILLILVILNSSFGLFFIFGFVALILILFPSFYRILIGFIPKRMLILAHPVFGFMSLMPGVQLQGRWFIEPQSEVRFVKSLGDVIKFIFRNWSVFFILNVGIVALIVRILLFIRGDPQVDANLLSPVTLSSWGFFFMFAIIPVIMAIYFVWVWVWEDAELKIAVIKKSSKGKQEETVELQSASTSISNIFMLGFGLPSILWLGETYSRSTFSNEGLTFGILGFMIVYLLIIGLTSGIAIFMGVMYYRSGVHQRLVNELRTTIKNEYINASEDEKGLISISRSVIQPSEITKDPV